MNIQPGQDSQRIITETRCKDSVERRHIPVDNVAGEREEKSEAGGVAGDGVAVNPGFRLWLTSSR